MAQQYPYDLRTGFPNTSVLVPHEQLAAITQQLLLTDSATQYTGERQGLTQARQQIASFLSTYSTQTAHPDEIVITSGAIAATDLVCRASTQPGDIVVVEDPTFYYMIDILKMSHIEVVPVPMTPDGLDLNALQAVVDQYGERVKLVYTIASFHNPTGINATPENRSKLVKMAQQHNFIIIEDTTYQWLYFEEEPPALCRHYDNKGGYVVPIGSFSKTIMPALRLGWIWAGSPEQAKHFTDSKGDGAAGALTSAMIGTFMEQGLYEAQLERARSHYAQRCHVLVEALQECIPANIEWAIPKGGYFVWMKLPDHIKASDVLLCAQARGADFMPGHRAFANGDNDQYMRLCFTMLDDEHLQKAAQIIAESIIEAAAQ